MLVTTFIKPPHSFLHAPEFSQRTTHPRCDLPQRAGSFVLLERGADPNYDSHAGKTGRERKGQPYTPLRIVMFCISDSLLEDNDLKAHAEVAKLLLEHGADPKPAMELAEERYGKYDPERGESLFMNVWHIVAGRK